MADYPDPESEDDLNFTVMKVSPAIVQSIMEVTAICDNGVQWRQVMHTLCKL